MLQKQYGDEILRIVQEGQRVTPNTHLGTTEEQQKQKIEEASYSDFSMDFDVIEIERDEDDEDEEDIPF